MEKLKTIDSTPQLSDIELAPINLNTNNSSAGQYYHNSLWNQNNNLLFQTNKANRVGDLIKVNIVISDKAKLENETKYERDNTDSLSVPNLFGINTLISKVTGKPAESSWMSTKSKKKNKGKGDIDRKEIIEIELSASIIKILPNGNFIIRGKQEILVNFELRQVQITGIVRPEDITNNNEVPSNKIAELRVSYTGKGHMADIQTPRIGARILDILSPF